IEPALGCRAAADGRALESPAMTDRSIDRTVHELFEAQARRTPDNHALTFDGAALSYASLDARANQLAHHLRTLGVGPDVLVAIYVERSFSLVVGLLAALKAGGAYMPLDPTYPFERLRFMLDDARPAVVLTERSMRSTLPA